MAAAASPWTPSPRKATASPLEALIALDVAVRAACGAALERAAAPWLPVTIESANATAAFANVAAIYALSRMWSDGIAAFVLGLHHTPFCEAAAGMCATDASAGVQLAYALLLTPAVAYAKHLSHDPRFVHLPGTAPEITSLAHLRCLSLS